jgi:aldose 1-epimerase
MKASVLLSIAAAATSAVAQYTTPNTTTPGPDKDGKYEISAEGIRAQFIPYGASISNLFIKDAQGIERDIVLGFDNASYYSVDPVHPHFGSVPGKLNESGSKKRMLTKRQVAMRTESRTALLRLMA